MLDREVLLWCVFVDKELAHRCWVAMSNEASEYVDPFPLLTDCERGAVVGKGTTTPKYRRLGIYTYVRSKVYQYLKEEGRPNAKLSVRKDTIASQKAQARLGSRIYGEGFHLKLLFWECWKHKPAKRT